jgi:ribosomal protein S27E
LTPPDWSIIMVTADETLWPVSEARRTMIELACPHCGRNMRVGDDAAGRNGKCKSCGKTVTVPGSGAEITFSPSEVAQPTRPAPSIRSHASMAIQPPPSPVALQINVQQPSKASHSLGIAAVILGILAFLICWIPLVGLLGLPLSGLGLMLGIGGIVLAALRKGSGLGFPIAGSAICALAMFVTISMTYAFGKAISATGDAIEKANKEAHAANQRVVDPKQDGEAAKVGGQQADAGPQKERPAPKDEWADAGNAVQQGDIRVRVESAKVDFVALKGIGRDEGQSKDKLLQITVRIENLGDSKKVEYRGWAGHDFDIGRSAGNIDDDLGNSYKRIGFGFANKVLGQIQSESIYPGKSITDVLVFEEPIQKAKFLKLELPASAFDGTGSLRIKIPMDMIELH